MVGNSAVIFLVNSEAQTPHDVGHWNSCIGLLFLIGIVALHERFTDPDQNFPPPEVAEARGEKA